MKRILFLTVLVIQGCNTPRGHYSEDGSTWIWRNQRPENIHWPLEPKLEATKKWLDKANKIDSLKYLEIDVLSKKWCAFKVNEDTRFFDENWLGKNSKTAGTVKVLANIGQQLSISQEETEELITGFVSLKVNRFSKEKDYALFQNETWLSFSKGYLYLPKEYQIKENDTINLNELTHGNCRDGWWNNVIIQKKITANWFEWYRPTGLRKGA
jgi:hypothetical protein